MEKLSEYPVIEKIKKRLKDHQEVKLHQYYDYERRLIKSPVLMTHVELLQQSENKRIKLQRLYRDYREENENHSQIWKSKYEYAEKIIKEYCGEKSYEYQVAFKDKDRLAAKIEQESKLRS